MDAFSYLSVLISVILGLAVTQILQGFRGLMLARAHVRGYWPCLVWAVLVLAICIQVWWAMYGVWQRPTDRWTFLDFVVVILPTIPVYLLAGLVLPDFDRRETLDLREHYYAHHRWFFALVVLLIVLSLLKVWSLTGHWPAPADTGFQIAFAIFATIGAWTAREWYHKLQAPLAALMFATYILVLFMHLK